MELTRPDWNEYGLHLAEAVSVRADCSRRKVGAVVFDTQNRVVSTGYNGSPPGGPSCLKGECPRGRHYREDNPCEHDQFRSLGCYCIPYRCHCKGSWPCSDAVEPLSNYDNCIASHAEANCLLWAWRSLEGCTMYITDEPCNGCRKLIAAARVGRVVYRARGAVVAYSP